MRRVATLVCALVLATFVLPSRAVAATVTTSWAVGVEPFGVTIDPRDGKAYVAISNHFNTTGSENMWVVDPTVPPPWNPPGNMPVLISLPSPQVMSVLDTSLDRLFVTSSPLAVVDVPSHSVIATVPGVRGAGIALDPATHHVFVATLSGAALVDGVSGAVLAQRSAPSASDVWWQVAHDPQRHRVYVANGNFTGAPSLVVLDDSDLSVIRTVPLPAIPRLALAVDSARGLVYVGGFSSGSAGFGSLYAVDQDSLQIVKTLDVSGGVASPFSLTLTPDGETMYASTVTTQGYPGSALVVVDLTSFSVRQRVALDFEPGQTALAPDGFLYVTELDKNRLARLTMDTAPSVTVALNTTSPRTNDALTATATGTDPEGDALTYTFTWSVNGDVRRTTTTTANTDILDLSSASNGDKGEVIGVSVVAFDGTLTSGSAWATATVANSAPSLAVSLNTSTPRTNDTLVATATGADPDRDALTYAYTWSVNRKVALVVTTTSSSSSFDLHRNDAANGDVVTVSVSASDGSASSAFTSTTAVIGKN